MMNDLDFYLTIVDMVLCVIDIGIIVYFFAWRDPREFKMIQRSVNDSQRDIKDVLHLVDDGYYQLRMIRMEHAKSIAPQFNRFKVKQNHRHFKQLVSHATQL